MRQGFDFVGRDALVGHGGYHAHQCMSTRLLRSCHGAGNLVCLNVNKTSTCKSTIVGHSWSDLAKVGHIVTKQPHPL